MKKLIHTEKNLPWIVGANNTVETYISDELPELSLCTAAFSFVFKDRCLLQTELKEGERPIRQLDIPGGHIDAGEHPEDAVIRETFEETGVRVSSPKLVGYLNITTHIPESDNPPMYPYPTGYMLYYICDLVKEEIFKGNDDTHGRVWLPFAESDKSAWCLQNKVFLDEVIKHSGLK